MRYLTSLRRALAAAVVSAFVIAGCRQGDSIQYRYATVDGIKIVYREAGDPASPTILLLHGFPSSFFMFQDLIPQLAGRYHVVAPDYPGTGYNGPQLDIPSNLQLYSAWQDYIRTRKPPTLVVWGRNDPVFAAASAETVKRLNPAAEVHL